MQCIPRHLQPTIVESALYVCCIYPQIRLDWKARLPPTQVKVDL
jgi:hypothetical protein